jgi:autotransporter adhesin
LAFGTGANATGSASNGIAIGTNANSSANQAIAVGMNSAATGTNALAIGNGAVATGSVAVGLTASAGNGGAAFGDFSSAVSGDSTRPSTALGNGANASAPNSVAIGTGAVVQPGASNSVALGAGSVATAPGTVSVGTPEATRRITNVSPAIYGTDAPNWGQVQDLWHQANRGIAMSMAMAAPLTPSAPGKTTISFGIGAYQGEFGASLNVVHRVNVSLPVFISAGIATSPDGSLGGRVSMGVEF